jgi:DNA-binding MarR family transcriptional regulator
VNALDRQLIGRFYSLMDNMAKMAVRQKPHKHSVSKAMFSVLWLVDLHSENGGTTTAELSRLLHVSKPAISQMINILEQKEYITRTIDTGDKRLVCIALTDLGKLKLQENKEHFLTRVNLILDRMGREDSETFLNLMEKCLKIMADIQNENEIRQ